MAATKFDGSATHGDIVTIDSSLVDSTQTHFVVRIPTSTLNASFLAVLRGDYQDIRVYDAGGTEYDRWIDGTDEIWVRVPSLSSSVNTALHFNGGSGASKGNDATAWTTAGYVARLSLNEDSGTYDSSTGTGDGTVNGGTQGATAKIEDGWDSDGTSTNQISLGDEASFEDALANPLSIEMWVKWSGWSAYPMLYSKGYDTSEIKGCVLQNNTDNNNRLRIILRQGSGNRLFYEGNTNISDTASFHHVVMSREGTSLADQHIWYDGSPESMTKTVDVGSVTDISNTDPVLIGNNKAGGTRYPTNGTFDEVRLSNQQRGNDWVSGMYRTQNSPATYLTESDYTVFAAGGGRISPLLNPICLGNNLFTGALA